MFKLQLLYSYRYFRGIWLSKNIAKRLLFVKGFKFPLQLIHFNTQHYSNGPWEGEGGGVNPTLYILVSKETVRKGEGVFFRGDFSWEVQCTLPKIIIIFTVRKNHMVIGIYEILRYRQTQLTTVHNRIIVISRIVL